MTARFSKIFLSLLLVATQAHGASQVSCPREEALLNRATELRTRGEKLLSAFHASELEVTAECNAAQYRQKAQLIYARNMMDLGNWDEARLTLKKVSNRESSILLAARLDEPSTNLAGLSEKDHKSIDLWRVRDDNFQKAKSPLLSGLLSAALPGAGQAYASAWQSAGVALLLNALFLAATVELYKHDLHASSLAAGMVFSVTYLGNISNAVQAAQKVNQVGNRPREDQLWSELFPEVAR